MTHPYFPNPGSAYITGNQEQFFTFEPGDTMFHVSFRTKGVILMNAILFANDETHVREILSDFVEFKFACRRLYEINMNKPPHGFSKKYHDLKAVLAGARNIPSARKGEEPAFLEITPVATPDHFIKVAWANNDTL